jgi:hypothetical protein
MATLAAQWKFDNNYSDSSGNANTLTAAGSGNIFSTTRKQGTHSLQLNGSGYASKATQSGITTGNADRSFGGWINLSTFATLQIPIYMGTQAANQALTIYNSTSTQVTIDQNGGGNTVAFTISENSANTWYWWWVEYTSGTKTYQFYIDNVSKGSSAIATNSNLTFGTPGLALGAAGDSSAGGSPLTGYLDDWRVYNGVTSAGERAAIMAEAVLTYDVNGSFAFL